MTPKSVRASPNRDRAAMQAIVLGPLLDVVVRRRQEADQRVVGSRRR
jgi:hypothetical protein